MCRILWRLLWITLKVFTLWGGRCRILWRLRLVTLKVSPSGEAGAEYSRAEYSDDELFGGQHSVKGEKTPLGRPFSHTHCVSWQPGSAGDAHHRRAGNGEVPSPVSGAVLASQGLVPQTSPISRTGRYRCHPHRLLGCLFEEQMSPGDAEKVVAAAVYNLVGRERAHLVRSNRTLRGFLKIRPMGSRLPLAEDVVGESRPCY